MTPVDAMLDVRDAQLAALQSSLADAQAEAAHYKQAFAGLWRLYSSVQASYAMTVAERDALAAQLECAINRNVARVCDEGQPGGGT